MVDSLYDARYIMNAVSLIQAARYAAIAYPIVIAHQGIS